MVALQRQAREYLADPAHPVFELIGRDWLARTVDDLPARRLAASQLPKTMVRFGFQPVFSNSPRPCTVSSMAAVPLFGSTAP